MMKTLAYFLLCSAITLSDLMAAKPGDFSDIPFAAGGSSSGNGDQIITMNLQRTKDYKDFVNN